VIRSLSTFCHLIPFAAGLGLSCLVLDTAAGEEDCGLCNTAIVTNSELATCFLDKYKNLAEADGAVIVVDLSECETARGGLEALPGPTSASPALEPDTQFMITRARLDCLKHRLEEPGLVLDPSAKIDLETCG
jgi:hypothetical protein